MILILRSIAKRCVSKDEATEVEIEYGRFEDHWSGPNMNEPSPSRYDPVLI